MTAQRESDPTQIRWYGKLLSDMSREELESALIKAIHQQCEQQDSTARTFEKLREMREAREAST